MRWHIFAYIPHATATPPTVHAAGSSMLAPARSLTLAERRAQPRIRPLRSLSYERDEAARLSPRARAVRARLAARSGGYQGGGSAEPQLTSLCAFSYGSVGDSSAERRLVRNAVVPTGRRTHADFRTTSYRQPHPRLLLSTGWLHRTGCGRCDR